jgi:UDP:flavonoid glycosyltransferase YjiC (YdhE family)
MVNSFTTDLVGDSMPNVVINHERLQRLRKRLLIEDDQKPANRIGVSAATVSWIAAGTPPIFFGFGSIPVESPAGTVEMINAACAQLGERALVCAGWSDFSHVPHFDRVKVVGALNYAAAFPACRAVVHHGGAGTTAAGLRAGVPTLILWSTGDQQIWGVQVKRLKVGTSRRFSTSTRESLVADLRTILAPHYVTRAREIATRMTKHPPKALPTLPICRKVPPA